MSEKQPNPVGRPTKYDPSMCETVIATMKQGFSKEVAALECGISKDTFYQYIQRHAEFADAVKEGERLSLKFWEGIGMKGMVGKIPGFNATTWIFNMKNRHNWADKQETKHSGDMKVTISGDDKSVL